ncbi:MAG TPA: hypothetical protein VFR88_05090 [Microlunatus sp.]|nr:hypothetical protein [Microlunatus sp.]
MLFDLDDTLLDHTSAAATAILQLVRSVPDWRDDDATTLTRWQDLEAEHFARYAAGEISMSDQRRARIRSFAALDGATDEVLDGWFDAYQRSGCPAARQARCDRPDRSPARSLRVGGAARSEAVAGGVRSRLLRARAASGAGADGGRPPPTTWMRPGPPA